MPKRIIILTIASLVAATVHAVIYVSTLGTHLELSVLDLWFNMRGQISAPEEVVIIALDESSYDILSHDFPEFGISPSKAWPRLLHAKLLKRLHEYGAKRVVFDVLFLGNDQNPQVDTELAQAFSLLPTVAAVDSGVREHTSGTGRYQLEEVLLPSPQLSESLEAFGLAKMPVDNGYVRRFRIPRTDLTRDIPSLHEAAAGLVQRLPEDQDMLLYYGPAGTITTFPYHQAFNPGSGLSGEAFRDKIVFVGLSLRSELGPAQKDTFRTPFYSRGDIFGVEIQATAAANLIQGRWISRAGLVTELSILTLVCLLLAFVTFWLKPQWSLSLLILFEFLWAGGAYSLFLGGQFIPGAAMMLLVLPLCILASSTVYYILTYRTQKQVENAFQRYVSPDMAQQLRKDPKALQLGGEDIYATAMFTDIEGFTRVTEGMLATDVSKMLNSYFTEVMEVIFERRGTLIKFIGDSVFAIWGAPIKAPDHPRVACETALIIQREVDRFNQSKRFPPLNTRIGINTGPMVVGNLGSEKRFDYTAIGDSVNLASRLEGINKYLGTKILVSENTRKELGSTFHTLLMGRIRVLGKKEVVLVHTVLPEPADEELSEKWLKAQARFRSQNWEAAAQLFEEIKLRWKLLSTACELYVSEIEELKKSPPSDDWEGEIIFGVK